MAVPSYVAARCVHVFRETVDEHCALTDPLLPGSPTSTAGCELPALTYSAYASRAPASLKIAVRHVEPRAVGLTHAISVNWLKSNDGWSVMDTLSFTPSNFRPPM